MAQDGQSRALGVTFGPSFFAAPDLATGVQSTGTGTFSPKTSGFGAGLNYGVSGGMSVGRAGNFDVGVGLSGFLTFGSSNNRVVDSFSGPGTVNISGYTTPANASINLSTNVIPGTSTATSDIDHTNPQGGREDVTVTDTNIGGADNIGTVTTAGGANSFALNAVATGQGTVNSAAAYGAVAATDGGIFLGAGDLTGLSITTDVSRGFVFTGLDATVAFSTSVNAMAVQAYAGPSYKFIGQSSNTRISVDIPEIAPSATVFPTYSMERTEALFASYFGGVVGGSMSAPIADNLIFSLGLEGGAYYVRETMRGNESYSVAGGVTPVPLTTVNNANGVDFSADGLAWSARISPSVTMALSPRTQLTLGASVDYLSRVATMSRRAAATTSTYAGTGNGNGTLAYNNAAQTNGLTFAPMWSITPTVSFTGQF
ncbi:hypothetical protein JI748_12915 [Devosia rhizoryzae]|uniref:Transferrin-binding protein B C-lobe/N-lobe beta barrel domain-containing protein n=2 Tax=Devosia rhizoryzae TaxID=2774137 RepID=A0ABX7C352_9HYPH|nr:hypothetical protein JI748_12915 [Devosia rhizoryzae]